MSAPWTLDQYFAARTILDRVYHEELGRDIYSDHDAFVNWVFHMREEGADEAAIRNAIRDSDEWRAGHGGGVPSSPSPSAPVPASPPAVGAGRPAAGGGRVIQVTDAGDGVFVNRGYSYWSQAWISGDVVYVFAGQAAGSPRFFRVALGSGQVDRLGPLIPHNSDGEGWYWDAAGWIYLLEGPRLRRVNPFTQEDVVVFDISEDHPGCELWQAHSSDDGRAHSATVRDAAHPTPGGSYPNIGTIVYRDGQPIYFPAQGVLDESQITPDGVFLVIKEDDDNRIINLDTRETRHIADRERAIGHSDCGPGFVVGEADKPDPGACVYWDLRQPLTIERCRLLYLTTNMGHASYKAGRLLLSDAEALYDVALDGSGRTRLISHAMVVTDQDRAYDFQVFANLDPTGRVACYLTNNGTDRLDVFLLVL